MRVPEHPTVIRRMLDARLAKLPGGKPILAASLTQIRKHCGRAACHCRQGGPLHTAWHLTFKDKGKTRTVYVPKDLVPEVQSWVAEYRRLKRLMAEVSQLSLTLVRGHSLHQRRKRGRP